MSEVISVLTLLFTAPCGVLASWELLKEVRRLPASRQMMFEDQRLDRVGRILFPEGLLDLVPAAHDPTGKIVVGPNYRTYANELDAISAIHSLARREAKEQVEDPFPEGGGHWVCIGSSVSNLVTRWVMGSPGAPVFQFTGSNVRTEFPYSIREFPETLVTRLQDGVERRVPLKAVVDWRGTPVATPEYNPRHDNELKSDVVLVTRLPRKIGGADQIIFASCHGPGIRAVRLFFCGRSDGGIERKHLERLEKKLGGHKYFQAIFLVPKLTRQDDTTVPTHIDLSPTREGVVVLKPKVL